MSIDEAIGAFPPVRGHLDAATAGVPPQAAIEATLAAVRAWADGSLDAPSYDADVERSRTAYARLLGVGRENVACGSHVSVFAGLVAAALAPGAEVLVARGDFASVVFPMLLAERRGVRVRAVELTEVVEAIDARTELVAVSAAQSGDGRVLDLEALAHAADHHGADVFLDGTQAIGWLPIDGTRFAYVVASAYKWLYSPRGTAFMAIRADVAERLTPHTAGWYATASPWDEAYGPPLTLAPSAKRFDVSPPWIAWAGTAPCLELVARLGPQAIGAYDLALAARLREGLGMPPYESAIVIAGHPEAESRLARAGVKASVRNGRVRLSCHLPATEDDVDRALEALT